MQPRTPVGPNDLVNVCRGFLMGGADIIPGVSGGTMALILGIYERLVTAISHVDTELIALLRQRRWVSAAAHVDLRFVATLGTGILLGIASLATLMTYVIDHHPQPTLAVFFGLILASSVLVARMIESWSPASLVLAVVGAGFAYWLVGQPISTGFDGDGYLFLCGMVAICAMILPGISGAFILLIMGKYFDVTDIIKDLVHGDVTGGKLLTLATFACGCVVGILSFSKLLRWLLTHHHAFTMAVLCGFMVGSLRKLWPFKELPAGDVIDFKHKQYDNVLPHHVNGQVVTVAVLIAIAVIFVILLDWVSRRRHSESPTAPRDRA